MAKQTINLGTSPTGAGGDTPRSAFIKVQANIDELYTALGGNTLGAATARSALGLGNVATLNAGHAYGQVMTSGGRDSPVASTINTWGNSFQMWTTQATVGAPEAASFGTIINSAYDTTGAYGAQILMAVTGRIWFRAGNYATALMREIYHTGNTTRAADGTLKAI